MPGVEEIVVSVDFEDARCFPVDAVPLVLHCCDVVIVGVKTGDLEVGVVVGGED